MTLETVGPSHADFFNLPLDIQLNLSECRSGSIIFRKPGVKCDSSRPNSVSTDGTCFVLDSEPEMREFVLF
jgi:hypothetical protein